MKLFTALLFAMWCNVSLAQTDNLKLAKIELKLNSFQAQRSAGHGIIMVGVLISAATVALRNNNPTSNPNVGYVLAGACFSAGFVITWGAGNKLRYGNP